jgi:formamidopyrimidine-DNA glycosylase
LLLTEQEPDAGQNRGRREENGGITMPEMPEVEQVRRSLVPHLQGRTITEVAVFRPKMVIHPSVENFTAALPGHTFAGVTRRGKYLTLSFTDGSHLLAHLRMTGALLVKPAGAPEPPFARLRFRLDDGCTLWFTDIRTFGTMAYVAAADTWQDKGFASLGPEPLSPEFTADYFAGIVRHSRMPIKSLILDQHRIAGLGNIYADESLALAGIRPTRPAYRLTVAERQRLWQAINDVIAQGLRNHGTTFRNYQDADGFMGNNQEYLRVYHRKGQPCLTCGTPLVQIKVGGRGSVYCPHCQK